MINGNDEQNLCYLLDPCFQIVNTAGAPLTSGWLEVYIHGTRTKYYCYSDWNRTLHPFKIPLDSLGSNIVLADPDQAYDVYVYNKYGALKMSRYNVKPGSGGSGSGQIVIDDRPISRIQVISDTLDGPDWVGKSWKYALSEVVGDKLAWRQDGSDINYGQVYAQAGVYHYDFLVKVDWHGELRNEIVRFQILGINPSDRDTWHSFDLSYPHTEFYHFSSFSNRMAGYEDRIFSDLDISPYGGAPEGLTAEVQTLTIYSLDDAKTIVKDGGGSGIDQVYHDQTMTGDGTFDDPLSVSTVVGQLEEMIDEKQDPLTPGEHIVIDSYNIISTSGLVDVHEMSGYMRKDEYPTMDLVAGQGINIDVQNNSAFISASGFVTPTQLETALNSYVTEQTFNTNIHNINSALSGKQDNLSFMYNSSGDIIGINNSAIAGGAGGGGMTYQAGEGIGIEGNLISVSGRYLQTSAYTAPVQSDWNQTNTSSLDYILNKPNTEEVQFEELDLSDYATKDYVDSATSGIAQYTEGNHIEISDQNQINVTGIGTLSAGPNVEIYQVNGGYAISAAPGGSSYSEGDYISIDDNVISVIGLQPSGDYQPAGDYVTPSDLEDYVRQEELSSYVKQDDLSGYAKQNDLSAYVTNNTFNQTINNIETDIAGKLDTSAYTAPVNADWNASSGLAEILNKPSTEEVQFEELDLSDYVQQDSLSGYAQKSELSGFITSGDFTLNQNNEITEIKGFGIASNSQDSDIFWAVYGTTTYEDTLTAYNAGKKIFVNYNGKVFPMVQKAGRPDEFMFTGIIDPWTSTGPKMQYITLSSRDGWYVNSNGYSIQADWNQADSYYPSYIKNKPDLGSYATKTELENGLANKLDTSAYVAPHEYTAGQNIAIQNDEISVSGTATLVAGQNVTITPSGESYIISSTGGGGGSTYTAGTGIAIDSNNVISVSGSYLQTSAYVAPVNADWNSSTGLSEILNKPSTEEVQFEELDLSDFVQQSDLSSYAQKTDLNGYQPTSGMSAYQTVAGMSSYAEKTDLGNYQPTSGMSAYQPTSGMSAYQTVAGMSTYATDQELASAVSGKQNKLTSVNDVRLVNALPGSPVSTTLYLIPEA